ncbi:ATP-dependent DNA helicase DinG [Polaromonas sp. CG_9.11]|uniref:ATP-dependent DNA helicase DinG n=1 Tax=Polaromonas sp. CG_9.11 TaxID=2787730 RepID=UPI0018CB6C4A|nr:ATP-dependent DNA helicase DinG [Polaromonas sp. CG_9.11]MBG6077467.1 ATP-dependent DNA helicase DinG [Polaromonas sp. CG_9.11]
MPPDDIARLALDAFDHAVDASGSFRDRPGQRLMAEKVAHTFSVATLGKTGEDGDEPIRAIAVVQAGTGVGKSLAYCAPAIAAALARNTRVMISTATVALQEQLVNKDLPALAAILPQDFRFGLAKGRGRYVCKLKLSRHAGDADGAVEADDDLFADELAAAAPLHVMEARAVFYAALVRDLSSGAWDGDRDNLVQPPESDLWSPVAAEASSCTGKHCPVFNQCTYYEKRKELVGAQVIVVNHDLLMSSLGSRMLPELDNCLLVLDEGHHLPAVALDHFAASMDLSRTLWLETLANRARRIGGLMTVSESADVPRLAAQLRQGMVDLSRLLMDLHGQAFKEARTQQGPVRFRLPRGVLPEALDEPLRLLHVLAESFLAILSTIAKALRTAMRDQPDEARRLSILYAQLGMLSPRLEKVQATTELLLKAAANDQDSVPVAKWFTFETGQGSLDSGLVVIKAHASPILPGSTLRQHFWSRVRAAVVTSATLTSCGKFDFYLRESGLDQDPAASVLEVASPFDYASQGRFVTVETVADPRHAEAFTAEMVQSLLGDLALVAHGALCLFTSREQMRVAVAALSGVLQDTVLVQGELPRALLLSRHRARVEAGATSVIFGMQSFGEGLDLPGPLCESVFIAKLPFASPDDPVGEARAEWLRSVGRDPFTELVVPATAIRLAQWAGRAIRLETDRAFVYCYDRRLVNTSYGRRLLQGLPAFLQQRRSAAGMVTPD